jgi:hypothetical protein
VISDRHSLVVAWLAAKDECRIRAVEEATSLLLQYYLTQWSNLIPIELHRLAATLKAEIVRMRDLKGDAFLLPTYTGFRILVKAGLPVGRYRSSVAHELAHTLFYSGPEKNEPRRIIRHSPREEQFCFDVARHVLVPREHLKAISIFNDNDPLTIFSKLTQTLLLSRPWAARVMLADYPLAKGIAGRWVKTQNGWKQQPGSATATPTLSEAERRKFREMARKRLESQIKGVPGYHILSVEEKTSGGIFVMVASQSRVCEAPDSTGSVSKGQASTFSK